MASDYPTFHSGNAVYQREPRSSVMLSARIWREGWFVPSVHRLINLSARGACIDQATALLRGDTVMVQIGSMNAIAASVVWSRRGQAGLCFAEPLDVESARRSRSPQASGVSAGWAAQLPDAYRR